MVEPLAAPEGTTPFAHADPDRWRHITSAAVLAGLLTWMATRWATTATPSDDQIAWIATHAMVTGLFALLARPHPWALAAAVMAAPLTSTTPWLAAGWVAGGVQAIMATPTKTSLESLGHVRGFFDIFCNDVVRFVLVVVLANLGSMVATSGAMARILGN